MHNGKIFKSGQIPQNADIDKINKYTQRPFTKEEVYIFKVALCDNDIDRDGERFSTNSLYGLQKMFLGKTGIFNHSMDTSTQSARIFDTYVEKVDNKFNCDGNPYCRLVASAYMPKCDKYKDLMLEIDSGIKKEVSVGCSMGKSICSICGADMKKNPCEHQIGKMYGNKICCTVLQDPKDAYEWSFVAVPAQPEAGVTKNYQCNNDNDSQNRFAVLYKSELINNIYKSLKILDSEIDNNSIKKITQVLSPEELRSFSLSLTKSANGLVPISPQLCSEKKNYNKNSDLQYKI